MEKIMNNYFVRYFSARIWDWVSFDVVAKSVEDVRMYIDTLCSKELRWNPDCFLNGIKKDSLKIEFKDKVCGVYIFDTGRNLLLELEHKRLEAESLSVLGVDEQNINEYKVEEYGKRYMNMQKKHKK